MRDSFCHGDLWESRPVPFVDFMSGAARRDMIPSVTKAIPEKNRMALCQ